MLTHIERERWNRDGFLLLPFWYSPAQVAALDTFCDLWDPHNGGNPAPDRLTIDPALRARTLLRDASASDRALPYKINDLYLESETLRAHIGGPDLGAILCELTGLSQLSIVNNLHLERGSQQEMHTDLFYMPGKRSGGLIATWTCLEDVHPDAGPLMYYRGSHRIPMPFNFSAVPIAERLARVGEATEYYRAACAELPRETALCKAGDVFIWHERLIHGGSPIKDLARTRRSIVAHYWRTQDVPGDTIRLNDCMSYWQRPHQNPETSGTHAIEVT